MTIASVVPSPPSAMGQRSQTMPGASGKALRDGLGHLSGSQGAFVFIAGNENAHPATLAEAAGSATTCGYLAVPEIGIAPATRSLQNSTSPSWGKSLDPALFIPHFRSSQ